MSERISITYTLEPDDLCKEVQRLYEQMTDAIDELSNSCSMPANLFSESTIRELWRIRAGLTSINYKLSDIENILKSYLNYITQPDIPADSNQLEDLQKLANTLSSLKNENTNS
tara:strand:- start:250 stop:591 length:342 start_codon:yes stop_codon:yes gene_type:complete